MTRPLISFDAEQSCRLLNETYAGHLDAIAAIAAGGTRVRRFATPDKLDREQIQRQATLIRFLAITESFSTERLHAEMDKIISALGHDGVRTMWLEAHQAAIMGWEKQQTAYTKWLNIPKTEWTDLLVLTQARNAAAHGSGRLTWFQQKNEKTLNALKVNLKRQLIDVTGSRIVLSEEAIERAAGTCTEFIRSIDATLS
ncbi:hypothetical protein [Rhodococcus sp. (in: high G+C Gram-positive bacteria)]|uniref:hypothetical protein n=1 Tax=Rhodococcus sp. TaxID=1831 RepID=UPI00257FF0BA|nr:hypothetical protein [Rhodococcus sp. (in: high G+C Gram-positive bacteria)]MBQ9055501.1 hypothetical protein [Rhodococcus sp. (in: high G+C Gram-positive bacteria)]